MKKLAGLISALSIVVFVAACGGGAAGSVATITGNVNTSATAAKPSARSASATGAALAGVTVSAVDANGTVVATAKTDGNGNYSVTVSQNGTYVIQVVSGSAVLKAIAAVGTSGSTINVNPRSTAVLLLLAQKLNAPGMGSVGSKFSSAISGMNKMDIDAAVADISNNPVFNSVATVVHDDLANCRNPSVDLGHGQGALLVGALVIGHHGDGGQGGHPGDNTASGSDTSTSSNTGTGTGRYTHPSSMGSDTSTESGTGTGTGTGTAGFCHGFAGTGTDTSSDTSVRTGTNTGTGTECNHCFSCMMIMCPVETNTGTGVSTHCPVCTSVCTNSCTTGTDTGLGVGTGTVTSTGVTIGMLTTIGTSTETGAVTATNTGTSTGPNTY